MKQPLAASEEASPVAGTASDATHLVALDLDLLALILAIELDVNIDSGPAEGEERGPARVSEPIRRSGRTRMAPAAQT